MSFYSRIFLILCFTSLGLGVENSGTLFSELFKTIANALIASGASKQAYPSESNGISSSVYGALQTIIKNDDLQCVPRLLCEAVAGGKPGGSRQLNIDKYSLSKLISYLQLDPSNASPMLAFGKAAVLGLSNRGDPYSCIINYPKCPKDETRLLYYLNNHRGGFFRFFDMKVPHQNYHYGQNSYYTLYPGNTYESYKPNQYYYRDQINYLFKAKENQEYLDTYAKKFGHSKVTFPSQDVTSDLSSNKVTFPPEESREEPRIQTKVVRPDYDLVRQEKNQFVFSNFQRYGKKVKDSAFFPYQQSAFTRPTHFVTDRLPSKFYFPQGDAGYHMKFPEHTSDKSLFFPKN